MTVLLPEVEEVEVEEICSIDRRCPTYWHRQKFSGEIGVGCVT
jgi:hypothetical protein